MNAAEQFETLVGEHYESLFRFGFSLTRSESDAQDLTQQTFYVWATKGHQLRDPSRARTWLYTTMHRAFLQTRRRQGRYMHHALEEVGEELPPVLPVQTQVIDSSRALSALRAIDEAYQGAVTLFYLEDYSYKEIAEILEVAIGTVKSRIARGISQLRRMLLSKPSRERSTREWDRSTSSFGERIDQI
jgi:RNA polymerase sigma-70 factor (ECF subfamily)